MNGVLELLNAHIPPFDSPFYPLLIGFFMFEEFDNGVEKGLQVDGSNVTLPIG